MLTAPMMSTKPRQMRGVSCSSKIVTPKNTAVRGSKAPRMAVGVEPIHWMAPVVQRREMAVGKRLSANALPHNHHWEGTCMLPSINNTQENRTRPMMMTQKVMVSVDTSRRRVLLMPTR